MPESDLQLLSAAARAAGEIATGYWRRAPKTWDKADRAGPVTEADLAVDEMLRDRLLAARPGYGWLSEETEDDAARLAAGQVFIIDPIDGTRSFIAGERTWSHSLAVARDGVVTAAVIYLPLRDEIFEAAAGAGARRNGALLSGSGRDRLQGANLLSARPVLDPHHWKSGPPPVHRHYRPSLAYRLALVAEGRFDAMLTLGDTWEWDVAAGTLINREAGVEVTDRRGRQPRFNNPVPRLPGLVVAPPPLHAQIRGELA